MSEIQWGLSAATLATIRAILAHEAKVEKAILFGSRAKGTYRRGSDIDLALVGRDLDIDVLGRLGRAFEESSIPYQVDLCWLAAVDHRGLREHIERVGQVLYERATHDEGARAARGSHDARGTDCTSM
ncbi:nucleotidyltransferase domain-containing protein [Methylocaldum szegediense]|uniref:Polbeta domain-containing protein n=1 Tax=Methylocaldum szegediense TaxID=73780 RepID=A0ABN8X7N3_9GAMM|nr:nucleotidyltransferase domain-containing protein [Methylocaldum szegediense]CAI8832496.1 Polbeta domain-containing protein [Methylocaldum szegediense]